MQFAHTHDKGWQTRVIFAFVMLFITLPSWSQHRRPSGTTNGDHFHFGYVSGHIGYSMLDLHAAGVTPSGNVGGGLGFGYEFRNKGLWVNAGLQASFHRSSLTLDDYQFDQDGLDTQNKETTLHYRVQQKDEMQWNYIDVPLLIGYYFKGFHVGAGLKVSYAIKPQTISKGIYTLSATNKELNVTFENMPDRGYCDYTYSQRHANRLNVGASVIGEIGYDALSSLPTHSRICHVLKIGFYFEYGLSTQIRLSDGSQKAVSPTPSNATQTDINPYVNCYTEQIRTIPFLTGIKVTYMVGGSRTARAGFHHGCMCYN